jgi:hypothetical protein
MFPMMLKGEQLLAEKDCSAEAVGCPHRASQYHKMQIL